MAGYQDTYNILCREVLTCAFKKNPSSNGMILLEIFVIIYNAPLIPIPQTVIIDKRAETKASCNCMQESIHIEW